MSWVALVGAGPGDPGLLTLRAAELLTTAEVVLCDRLVSAGVRARIAPDAEVIDVGKRRGGGMAQERVIELLLEHARAGRRVVRLKGGDPFVFGRGGEEALALAEAGFDVEVVPGVTSAIAGPAAAGIPVTHRELASSVCILTAEETAGARRDWSPAVHADTVVLLMGVSRLARATQALVAAGKSPDTPAALVQDATLASQRTVTATLGTLTAAATDAGIRSPALAVIGRVVSLSEQLARKAVRPRVLVTRAAHQAQALVDALRLRGLDPVVAPAIRIAPAPKAALTTALRDLGTASWVVFTSANGVAASFDALAQTGQDARAFAGTKVAAIGAATAQALADRGIVADLVPAGATTTALADALPPGEGPAVLLRADRADEALGQALEAKGYEVREVVAYRIVAARSWPAAVIDELRARGIALVTFASADTARATAAILTASGVEPQQLAAVCIGEACADGARDAGFVVRAVAEQPSVAALADAAAQALG